MAISAYLSMFLIWLCRARKETGLSMASRLLAHRRTTWNKRTMWQPLNEQNQHFAELRQKICLYIHVVVLQRGLPSLDDKLECFVKRKWTKRLPNSSQTDWSSSLTHLFMFIVPIRVLTSLVIPFWPLHSSKWTQPTTLLDPLMLKPYP